MDLLEIPNPSATASRAANSHSDWFDYLGEGGLGEDGIEPPLLLAEADTNEMWDVENDPAMTMDSAMDSNPTPFGNSDALDADALDDELDSELLDASESFNPDQKSVADLLLALTRSDELVAIAPIPEAIAPLADARFIDEDVFELEVELGAKLLPQTVSADAPQVEAVEEKLSQLELSQPEPLPPIPLDPFQRLEPGLEPGLEPVDTAASLLEWQADFAAPLEQLDPSQRLDESPSETFPKPLDHPLDPERLTPETPASNPPPSNLPPSNPPPSRAFQNWYLGIDFGSTGISAVLLDRQSCSLHPLYWITPETQASAPAQSGSNAARTFRLPTPVFFPATSDHASFILQQFKSYLRLGIPHVVASRWEPALQWTDQLEVPLSWVRQALQGLLSSICGTQPNLHCGAVAIEDVTDCLRQLAGVIVNCPSHWSDTYCFNVREAILRANLVPQPDQIFFVPDAIASLLSVLPSASLPNDQPQPLQFPTSSSLQNQDWTGNTLIIAAGASVTDIALVNLLPASQVLTNQAFSTRSVAYAGLNLEQDILCQLINPTATKQPAQKAPEADSERVDFELDHINLDWLHLEDLTLPIPGEADLLHRHRLQQRLESSPEGQQLMDALTQIKLLLQQKLSVTVRFGTTESGTVDIRTLLRQDLSSQVLLPYVQRLNREVNGLLSQTETAALSVKQILCTGGSASFAAIARWLRQKFPNATIHQDTYPFAAELKSEIDSCSRVAYGLAALPLHPQVLEGDRHQYSDYFLLHQLLQIFPSQSVTFNAVCRHLAQLGIDTDQCEARIAALLAGQLPDGFVPDATILIADSLSPAQAVQLAPLFQKYPDQTFHPDRHQYSHFRHYFELLLRHSQQKLDAPLQNHLIQAQVEG